MLCIKNNFTRLSDIDRLGLSVYNSLKMSWKWVAYAVLSVIIEVSATTVAKRSDNLFHTA